MKEAQTVEAIRLRLLALVLALALTWYALNPAPAPVRRVKREEEQPDEKRREGEMAVRVGYAPELTETSAMGLVVGSLSPVPELDIDDLDWPEFIDGD